MDRETKKIKKKNNLKYIITFSLLVERRVQDIPLATYLLLVFFFGFSLKKKGGEAELYNNIQYKHQQLYRPRDIRLARSKDTQPARLPFGLTTTRNKQEIIKIKIRGKQKKKKRCNEFARGR